MDPSSTVGGLGLQGAPSEVIFYFDIVCPFSWIAAERIEEIGRHQHAKIIWRPVVLGGLYELNNASQGKDGSATDVYNAAKKAVVAADFQRELGRYQLPLKLHPQHPVSTIDAGRLLCAFPDHLRPRLALALYRAYFVDQESINSRVTLLRIARSLKLTSVAAPTHSGPFSLTPSLPFPLDESVFSTTEYADRLRANTDEAFGRGAFGVPSFYVPARNKLLFGQDRLPLLEAELISLKVGRPFESIRQLERLLPRCLRTPPETRKRVVRFWFDFSSPWSYLAWSQLERLVRDGGEGLTIEYKPFLLGALFKQIGSPLVPMSVESENKQKYVMEDLQDWSKYWSCVNQQEYPPIAPVPLKWPDTFPIKTVDSLRIAILEPKTIAPIFYAAWRDNQNISDPKVLAAVLTKAGFDGPKLIASVTTGIKAEAAKTALRATTQEAVDLGLCGAPTFQIGSKWQYLVWGQDRMNVVQDLALGWRPGGRLKATVSGFAHYDYRL